MKENISFNKKYRPNNFSQIAQHHILIKVISNSIKKNKLSNSYLITGNRGIGKTSAARIIAKLFNCTNQKNINKILTPCEKCDNCLAKNNHPDILEIDAASSTGIDDAKSIINQSNYVPILGKYKIFIIDEVHMFSKSAFNALLKPLEESHKNVIFILVTTEIDKVPFTVISRCQRFNLNSLTNQEIYTILIDICTKENLKFSKEALFSICNYASGSARDAVLLLEQISLFNDNNITTDIVENIIGIINDFDIMDIIIAIIEKNTDFVFKKLKSICNNNLNLSLILNNITSILSFFSKKLLDPDYKDDKYSNLEGEKLQHLYKCIQIDKLTILWQIFVQGIQDLKNSHNEFLVFEMIFIKAMYSIKIPSLDNSFDIDQSNNFQKKINSSQMIVNSNISKKKL